MNAHAASSKTRLQVLIWALFCAALFVTNTSILPSDHLTHISAYDTWIYLSIADAAPGVPPAGSELVYHGAMRFLFPYILGILAKTFGMTSWSMFRVASHVLVSLTIAVFWAATGNLSKNWYLRLLATAVLSFNVYLFRLQLAFSGFINDTLFVLSLTCAIYATLNRKHILLFFSILIMGIGKQTVFFVLPMFLAFSAVEAFQRSEWGKWFRYWIITIGALIGYYWLIHQIILPFSSLVSTKHMLLGLANFFMSAPFTETSKTFLIFVSLGIFGGLGSLLFIFTIWMRSKQKISPMIAWLAAFFLLSIVQPILSGPVITDRSIMRLEAIGTVPLILMALRVAEESNLCIQKRSCLTCIALLFAASFHHLFSIVGPDQSLRVIFASTHLALLFVFSYLFYRDLKPRDAHVDLAI